MQYSKIADLACLWLRVTPSCVAVPSVALADVPAVAEAVIICVGQCVTYICGPFGSVRW